MIDLVKRSKGLVHKAKGRYRYLAATLAISAMMAMTALAAEGEEPTGVDIAGITGTMTTSFNEAAQSLVSTILAILPVIMSILTTFICIKYGIAFFQKLTGTAAK